MKSFWLATKFWGHPHETDVSSSESQTSAQARVSRSDANEGRPEGREPAPPQGAETVGGQCAEEIGDFESGGYRFPRGARIRRQSDIRALYRRGRRRRTDHLDVFVTESPVLRTRVAVVVPKHGRKIIERNRLKRRLKECVRLTLLPRCRTGTAELDILVRARPSAYEVGVERLVQEVSQLAGELCSRGS